MPAGITHSKAAANPVNGKKVKNNEDGIPAEGRAVFFSVPYKAVFMNGAA